MEMRTITEPRPSNETGKDCHALPPLHCLCSHQSKARVVPLTHNLADAAFVPSRADITEAYNLEMSELKNLERTDKVAEAEATARFIAAFWAGPRHAAMAIGEDSASVLQIEEEFNALLYALHWPRTTLSRRFAMLVMAEEPGWRLKLQPVGSHTRATFGCKYENLELLEEDADVLHAMLFDPEWSECAVGTIFEAWQQTVSSRLLPQKWLDGGRIPANVAEDTRGAVLERARRKFCLAPGLVTGCYRSTLGQLCVPVRGFAVVREMAARWGINPEAHGVIVPHTRAALKTCGEMAGALMCVEHFVADQALSASFASPETYRHDDADERFVQPGSLRAVMVPQVDPGHKVADSLLGKINPRLEDPECDDLAARHGPGESLFDFARRNSVAIKEAQEKRSYDEVTASLLSNSCKNASGDAEERCVALLRSLRSDAAPALRRGTSPCRRLE